MASVKITWKREEILKLIQLVESCPCLWNVATKEYHDSIKRRLALGEICAKLNINCDEVKKKLHTLCTQHGKECVKIRNSKSGSGLADVYKWEHFSPMEFMFQHTSRNESIDSMYFREQLVMETSPIMRKQLAALIAILKLH